MRYYEVLVASGNYHASSALTYSSDKELDTLSIVTIPLRKRMVTGFIIAEVDKPNFTAKPIKNLLSKRPLPAHCLELAQWMSEYYACSLGEALRQFAPSKPTLRQQKDEEDLPEQIPNQTKVQLGLQMPLTKDQSEALAAISKNPSTTILLHGHTGTGKTRVYVELAKKTIGHGKSVILLTPEIALTSQLTNTLRQLLDVPVYVLHSHLKQVERKKIWLAILESTGPLVIVGPRSALFSPVHNLGLVILDEAHETAYKQDQSPRYHAARVASQLGLATKSRVILGTATPSITDYYLAKQHNALVKMTERAIKGDDDTEFEIIDLRDRTNLTASPYLSNHLIKEMGSTLASKKQVLIYLNRRGSARLILCNKCGWQLLCPNCDIPLVYHGDMHSVRCHICGFNQNPPKACPKCENPDIIYRSAGTKALVEAIKKLFPNYRVQRFDSDNTKGESFNEVYEKVYKGDVDILVGTQTLAKGIDLPKLGLVGIISAESSLALPDFSSEERAFQLLYQVIGRVGRGHNKGKVLIQTYEPESVMIESAVERDYEKFYEYSLKERKDFKFPPFSYLMQLLCKRITLKGAQQASKRLAEDLAELRLPVEIIGPAPNFYARRGRYHYYQIIVKSKTRDNLLEIVKHVPQDWTINLDPVNLL